MELMPRSAPPALAASDDATWNGAASNPAASNPATLKAATLDPARLAAPIWVVAPHPDDEALGCGALICALTGRGLPVWALLLTDGGFSHPASREYPRPRLAATRLDEWRRGLQHLGVPPERTRALGLPDGQLEQVPALEVAAQVQAAFAAAPPGTVLLPWRRDPHPDHRAAWAAVQPICPTALGYAVWLTERGAAADWPASDEAKPLQFAVGPHRARKAAAIAEHATQLGAIRDDPGGFTLDPRMVGRALDGPELYFRPLTGRTS